VERRGAWASVKFHLAASRLLFSSLYGQIAWGAGRNIPMSSLLWDSEEGVGQRREGGGFNCSSPLLKACAFSLPLVSWGLFGRGVERGERGCEKQRGLRRTQTHKKPNDTRGGRERGGRGEEHGGWKFSAHVCRPCRRTASKVEIKDRQWRGGRA